MKTTPAWTRGLAVEVGRTGIVSHAGSAALRLLASKVGLTTGLSTAWRRKGFTKEKAAPTHKHTFGFRPLTAWCDNTRESLALRLRAGNAGSNTAADHLAVANEAITQIPAAHRRDLLVTCDGAGAARELVNHITALNARRGYQVHYSVGFDLDARARAAIGRLPERVWQAVLDPDGEARAWTRPVSPS